MSIPTDLINEIQIHLRAQSGLSNYNPSTITSHPSIPSLEDSISIFDQSELSLRCKNCKGRFLRGVNSVFCVYCGKESENLSLESLKFKETVGFKWLLQTLKLDGSEIVGPLSEENESNRGQTAQKDGLSVSDLLDLEIKWLAKPEKDANSDTNNSTAQNKTSLNLAGVDLDSFFSEPNKDTILNASKGELSSSTQKQSVESSSLESHKNVNLFQNVQPAETSVQPAEHEIADRFSGWEAEFQSFSSETVCGDRDSFVPFGSSTGDLSVHMDAVFGSEKDGENKRTSDSGSHAPTATTWSEDYLWSNFNSGVSNQGEKLEGTSEVKDGPTPDQINTPSINDDLVDGLQWQTSSSKVPDNDEINENDDSFDDWNDFASSSSPQKPYNSSSVQTFEHNMSSAERSAEINQFSPSDNLLNMERGNSVHTDFFSGSFSDPNNSTIVNNLMPEASVSNRLANDNVNDGKASEQDVKGEKNIDATTGSKVDYVEMLMSQMHDLSFMLESDLSIPKS